MLFRELSRIEYINFAFNFSRHSFYQSVEFGDFMASQGHKVLYVGLINNNYIVAASLILIKKEGMFYYAYAPKGFLLDYCDNNILNNFTQNLKKYLSNKNVAAIKINPLIFKNAYDFKKQLITNYNYQLAYKNLTNNKYYHYGFNNFFEAYTPRFEAIIDLRNPLEILWGKIKKQYRTKIRSALNCGVEIYQGNANDIMKLYPNNTNYFKSFYDSFYKSNSIDIFYTKLNTSTYLKHIQSKINNLEKHLAKLNLKIKKAKKSENLINKKINISKYLNDYKNELVIATHNLRTYPDGIITSWAMIIRKRDTAYIMFDDYNRQFKKINSKHLLIWQLINIYKKANFNFLNLGGVSNLTIDKNKYVGLDNFKINFNSIIYEYIGDFELITSKAHYSLYRNYKPFKKFIKGIKK